MAGGDGSLAVVATAAAAHDLPFICVPAGTRNHFALDLGVDRHDLLGALDAFTEGVERRIDVAEVNGRLFLNNVSLGVYGEAVREAAYRDAKARTLLETAGKMLGPSGAAPDLGIVDETGREHPQLAVLLVSNNPYALEPPAPSTRPALDRGVLGVLLVDAPGAGGRPPVHAWSTAHVDVTASGAVDAGLDGEAVRLNSPLRFTVRPGALTVRISARHPGRSPSAELALHAPPGPGLPTPHVRPRRVT
jgi:diacylglycerol kinase family enzyme